jgi:hypothetical protein
VLAFHSHKGEDKPIAMAKYTKKGKSSYLKGNTAVYENNESEISYTVTGDTADSHKNALKVITDEPASKSPEDALRFDNYSKKLAVS